VEKPPEIPADWDPCPRRTRGNLPCGKPRFHIGACAAKSEFVEDYRIYADHVRVLAQTMTRHELGQAMEFHLLAWRVLRSVAGER
jgi:hypothetical protein